MADKSKIEWTDATWNPITGCKVKSPGCINCYAMWLAATRMRNHPSRAGLTNMTKAGPVWNGKVRLNEQWMDQPSRWRNPRSIFVVAHGDLFYDAVPFAWVDQVFAQMQAARQHFYQVLTKRPDRAHDYLRRVWNARKGVAPAIEGYSPSGKRYTLGPWHYGDEDTWRDWPMPHIWIGTSVERQQEAHERLPALREIAAAGWNTWVSYEPALGPVDWSGWEFIRWMVSGGESDKDGKSARPHHPQWHRATRDWCARHGIPYLFKQWGGYSPSISAFSEREPDLWLELDGRIADEAEALKGGTWKGMFRVGKTRAGRLLDGREHNGFPELTR